MNRKVFLLRDATKRSRYAGKGKDRTQRKAARSPSPPPASGDVDTEQTAKEPEQEETSPESVLCSNLSQNHI